MVDPGLILLSIQWRKIMTAEMTAAQEIESFFEGWQGEIQPMRDWFRLFYQELSAINGVRSVRI